MTVNDIIARANRTVRGLRAKRKRHADNLIQSVVVRKLYSYELHDVIITRRANGQQFGAPVLPLDGWLWHGTCWVDIPVIGLRYVQVSTKPGEDKMFMPGSGFTVTGTLVRTALMPNTYTRQVIEVTEIVK